MASMNQYGAERDRTASGTCQPGPASPARWTGRAIAEKIPIRVPHPFLGFVGGIVPDMIGSFCDERGRHDGFLDRFLFTYPDPVPKSGWRDEGIPDEVSGEWSQIIDRLQALPMKIEESAISAARGSPLARGEDRLA